MIEAGTYGYACNLFQVLTHQSSCRLVAARVEFGRRLAPVALSPVVTQAPPVVLPRQGVPRRQGQRRQRPPAAPACVGVALADGSMLLEVSFSLFGLPDDCFLKYLSTAPNVDVLNK